MCCDEVDCGVKPKANLGDLCEGLVVGILIGFWKMEAKKA